MACSAILWTQPGCTAEPVTWSGAYTHDAAGARSTSAGGGPMRHRGASFAFFSGSVIDGQNRFVIVDSPRVVRECAYV